MKDDKNLVKSCLKGNEKAFEMLVDKYKTLVCSIAYCSTGDVHTSEDIAQDVFFVVWENLSSLKDHGKFKAWLTSITRNTLSSYLSKNSKNKTYSLGDDELQALDGADPSEGAAEQEESAMIWNTIAGLPIEYREVLVLYYRNEKSTGQVAEMLSLSPEAVRQRLSRGRQMIRERIEERLEAGLRRSRPGKEFTASIIAAISSIPVGVGVSEAAAGVAASSGSIGTLSAIFTTTAAKVASVAIIAAAAVTAVIILSSDKSEPAQNSSPLSNTFLSDVPESSAGSEVDANTSIAANKVTAAETLGSDTQNAAEEISQEPLVSAAVSEEEVPGFTPKGVLSGLITDKETCEPVIDGYIQLDLPNNEVAKANTDENGFYYFESLDSYGNCELDVTSMDYVSLQNSTNDKLNVNVLAENQTIQHLELEKACLLEVLVVDEEDKPIEGAEVTVFDSFKEFKIVNTRRKTNKEGRLITGGIKPSKASYSVMVVQKRRVESSNGISDFCRDYSPTHANVVLDNPEIMRSIKIVMQKGFDIRGRLLYVDKVPASDLIITVEPKWWKNSSLFSESSIEEDGAFIINNVISDNYDINVLIPTGGGILRQRTIATQYLDEGNFLDFVLPFNSPSNLVPFSGKIIFEGKIKSGSIIISGRSDISEFSRSIYCSEDDIQGITFDIERVQPGLYSVDITGKGVEDVHLKNVQIPINDFTQTLKCVVDKVVTGIVIDKETQKPLHHFKLMPHLIETSKNVNILKEDWISYTNKAGIFEVELEYDGIYEFTVAAENYAPQIVTVDTLKNRSFVAELVEGNKLSGRVIDSNGKPVKNAKLIPFTVNSKCSGYYNKSKLLLSEKYSCTTSDDGSFVLSNLPEKSETVKILHPNFIEKIMDIELPYSEKFVVTLARGGNIEGCVYDNNGNKKSHIIIYLTENKAGFADQNIVKETITDDNGCYEFTNVDSVPLYAKIRSTKIVEGVSCCYVLPEKDKTINLDLGGEFFLKGKVFIDNIPLASTPIAVIDSPSYIRSGFRNFGITEPDGSFMFSGITEGVKRLVYNYDVNDWRLITEFDSKGIDFDIGDIFIDVVNIEVEIDSDDVAEKCFVAENFMFPCENVFYMSSLGNNTFSAENIQPGKHVVMISTETSDGVFAKEIDVSNSEIPLKFNIKLPQANSSLYGHVDNRRPFIIKKEDNSFFTFYKNDYKLINIPAGKYVVETYPEKKVLTTFELEEGEELELDLDVILK